MLRQRASPATAVRAVVVSFSVLTGSTLTIDCGPVEAIRSIPTTTDGLVRSKACCRDGPGATTAPDAGRSSRTAGPLRLGKRATADTIELAWRFHAGAPLDVPPAVTADGNVVVATSDGYVDFLHNDGTLRWSYTVDGSITGTPLVGQRSLVVGTSAGQLVSLSFDGTARWEVRIGEAITTHVEPEHRGLMFFGVASPRVYGAFPTGAAISFKLHAPVSAGPIRLDNGSFAVGTSAGQLLRFDRTGVKQTVEVTGSVLEELFVVDGSTLHALSSNALHALDPAGKTLWKHGGVRAAAVAADSLVILESDGNELAWLDPSGCALRRAQLDGQASGAPTLAPDGLLYVPRVDGRLDGLSEDGVARVTVAVCRSRLLRPVADFDRARLIVAGADGTVVAARIGATPRTPLP